MISEKRTFHPGLQAESPSIRAISISIVGYLAFFQLQVDPYFLSTLYFTYFISTGTKNLDSLSHSPSPPLSILSIPISPSHPASLAQDQDHALRSMYDTVTIADPEPSYLCTSCYFSPSLSSVLTKLSVFDKNIKATGVASKETAKQLEQM